MKIKLGKLTVTVGLSLLTSCAHIQPTAIITGAISKHLGSSVDRDEKNPLLGVEFNNNIELGVYDNSRIKTSSSIYGSYKFMNRKTPFKPIRLTMKAGVSLYDNQSGYNFDLKPFVSIGGRIYWHKKQFIDIDYLPSSILNSGGDLVTITYGHNL